MNKFKWGNLNDPHVYLDEQNQRMVMNFRNMFCILSDALIREGKTDSARKVLDRCLEEMPEKTAPFNFFAVPILEGYYKIGDVEKANKLNERLFHLMDENLSYLFSFPKNDLKSMAMSLQEPLSILQRIQELSHNYKQEGLAKKIDISFQKYYEMFMNEAR